MKNRKQLVLLIAVILFSFIPLLSANVTNGELEALNDLYNACDGTQWVNQTNWLVGDPCNNLWYGVSCTSGHVTALQLTSNGLYGTLPSSLSNLYELESLIFDDNEISGSIPSTFNQIKSLGKIDLHSNFFSSSIPNDLGDLLPYNLEYLDLSDNKLTGAIPTFFDNPPNYFYANLSNNLFTCPIPSWAQYTSANCIQLLISAVDPACTFPSEDINIYGQNFLPEDGLSCALFNTSTNTLLGTSPATIVSDSHIICRANYSFKSCGPNPGSQTFINVNVKLLLNGQDASGNTTKQIGLINYSCPFGQTVTSGSITYAVPNLAEVFFYCPFGNPTPYSCPSYISSSHTVNTYVTASVNPYCSNSNYNTTCLWAPTSTSGYSNTCPFYYCGSSTAACTLSANYCPSYYTCYGEYSECTSQSTCTH